MSSLTTMLLCDAIEKEVPVQVLKEVREDQEVGRLLIRKVQLLGIKLKLLMLQVPNQLMLLRL
jgi:hypothetical protein